MRNKHRRPVSTRGGKMSQGGRGALLENLINDSNNIYQRRGEAMVQKIPTPITPISMNGAMITKAFFAEKSTVDYVGVWNGKALCFDAKESHKDTFPLKNIHAHQIRYMDEFSKCGGYAFLILYYTDKDVFYFMPLAEIRTYFERMENGGRKSIAFDELEKDHFFTTEMVPVPYLTMLSKYISQEDNTSE